MSVSPATARPSQEAVSCDCLPGYRLLDCLGRSPLAETWLAQDPDGKRCAVKYIYAAVRYGNMSPKQMRAARRLTAMRHPNLAAIRQVADDHGRLVLVTCLAEQTLADRFRHYERLGYPGMPRGELLDYLEDAAKALDYLHREHEVCHLSLNPWNLLVLRDRLLVADFGLVQLVWVPSGQKASRINARFSAPELFDGRFSPASDQYSLALIYHQLLVGRPVHHGNTYRQLAEARRGGLLHLEEVSAPERPVLARALRKVGAERFPTCTEFIHELRAAVGEGPKGRHQELEPRLDRLIVPGAMPNSVLRPPAEVVQQLVLSAAEKRPIKLIDGYRFHVDPDGALIYRFAAWLPEVVAQQKLYTALSRWHAEIVDETPQSLSLLLHLQPSIWQRVWDLRPSVLELRIQWHRPQGPRSQLADVRICLRCPSDRLQHQAFMERIAPFLIEDLQMALLATRERRVDERFPFDGPLRVTPCVADTALPRVIMARGKNISTSGIGLYVPDAPDSEHILISQVSTRNSSPFAIPAAVIRLHEIGDGWYEVGARFTFESPSV